MAAATGSAEAQWQLGIGVGIEGHGRWVESSPSAVSGGPDGRPTTTWPLEIDLSRGGSGRRIGIRLSRSRPGLELYDATLRVALQPAFQVTRIAPESSVPAHRFSRGGQLRFGIGLPVEQWSFPDSADPPRWRVGGTVTVAIELPMSSRMTARIYGSAGTLFSHPFAGTEPIDDYIPTRTWRRALGIGVGWRL